MPDEHLGMSPWDQFTGVGSCWRCHAPVSGRTGSLCERFLDPNLGGKLNIRVICVPCATELGYVPSPVVA
jgi:hypothetical protein